MPEHSSEKQTKPLVSVIIPFYNCEEFLAEAIESVLAQTEENWELFLADDGSQDKSAEIAREFVKKYPNRIYFFMP